MRNDVRRLLDICQQNCPGECDSCGAEKIDEVADKLRDYKASLEDLEALQQIPQAALLTVPLFHVTGLVPVMLGSFVGGAKLVMTHRWDPDRALELIEQEQVTNFVGVPTMSWDLLEASTFAERDTSSLRSVGGGGAPMPPELVKRIDENFSKGKPGLG